MLILYVNTFIWCIYGIINAPLPISLTLGSLLIGVLITLPNTVEELFFNIKNKD